jgi:hypothetical protein
MTTQGWTKLEQAVLDKLLAGSHPVLTTLRAQVASARVVSREQTGVGFFCTIEISTDVPVLAASRDFELGDVDGCIEGLEHGAGFLLFVRGGFIRMLEGYTYGEPWPAEVTSFSLSYAHQPREFGF